jgi:hypothetical protein
MFFEMMSKHVDRLAAIAPTIDRIIDALDARQLGINKPQALALAACVLDRKPNLILDLGTGLGTSASVFALASGIYCLRCQVCTFDLDERRDAYVEPRIRSLDRSQWDPIAYYVEDIETFDFARLARAAKNTVVFWDAHGHAVARGVLCNLMPLIADNRHLVICHDMADNRLHMPNSYEGKTPWCGMDDWYRAASARARVNLGWVNTIVDQVIPILDFCHRNEIEFHSVDHDVHIIGEAARKAAVAARLGFRDYEAYGMGYFTMEDTACRNFPGQGTQLTVQSPQGN